MNTSFEKLNNVEILRELGNRLKQVRIAKNLSREELAKKSGVSTRSLSRLESGESINVTLALNIFRELNLLEGLSYIVPQQDIMIDDFVKLKHIRKRASRIRHRETKKIIWKEDLDDKSKNKTLGK